MAIFSPGRRNVVAILVPTGWATYCRLARGQVLALREKEYVLAARVLGAPSGRLIRRHILSNLVATITVISTMMLAPMASRARAQSTRTFPGWLESSRRETSVATDALISPTTVARTATLANSAASSSSALARIFHVSTDAHCLRVFSDMPNFSAVAENDRLPMEDQTRYAAS
jgi:hypothetical protein